MAAEPGFRTLLWQRGDDLDAGLGPHEGYHVDHPFAGFSLRYLQSMQARLTEHGGKEWIEVVHPTMRGELDVLRILPTGKESPRNLDWVHL
ncbi:hypothetical protein [Actinoplanes sp. NPDC049118]|uniref:hypothetical protein n=1 Tax=Actinoplanes sp. NPDC049118 TaxID=3155769 RepID=UPI00340742F4